MNRHVEFDELQDYREGLLLPEEHESIRAHLDECSSCQQELEALSTLMDGLGELPVEAEPSRDLWPQIEWRVSGGSAPAQPDSPRIRRNPWRQVTLPAWQLFAASITLVVISGGVMWAALSGTPQGPLPLAPAPFRESMAQPVGWETALGEYNEAVADLEGVLERGREVLDRETVRILEESLLTIDRAVQEAQDALSQDPGSKILRRFLSESLRRKVDILRQAAAVVYANS